MKKLFSLMLTVVLLMTIAPAALGASSETDEYGKLLAAKLVASEDAIALWDGLSKEEQGAVRDFAQSGISEVEKFTQARISDSTLQQNISKFPEDQALAILINLFRLDIL